MKFLPQRTFSSVLIIVSLAVLLVALAALQYRWSGQVRDAERERMHTSLLAATNQFRLHFNSEFRQLGMLFRPEGTVLTHRDWNSLAASFDAVLKQSNRRLVSSIYLWTAEPNGKSQLLKLNRDTKTFDKAPWPSAFEKIRNKYSRFFAGPFRPGPEIRPFEWITFCRIPLMLQPLIAFSFPGDVPGTDIQLAGFILMELNLDTIRNELFPDLARKYFEGPKGFIYQIAVATRDVPDMLLYKSDPQLTLAAFAAPDASIDLFENQLERFGPRKPNPEEGPRSPDRVGPAPPEFRFRLEPPSQEGRGGRGRVPIDNEGPGWELMAKHSKGSLEVAIAANRKRNLALSLGSLLLLAISMALIIVSARRAQKLARLQIDFVAGISHELRTPLSVICSAADNLAEGVIEGSVGSTRQYGELIRGAGRRLTGMIEQILQFASMQRSRHQYNIRPENINEIVEAALHQVRLAIETAGFSVEKNLSADLPRINADAAVLSHLIQNLIQNALKYSGESRWLAIRSVKAPGKRKSEVQLTVEDRGMGINGEDLPHIFEPFYRGGEATSAQIHGSGLGLYMVREALAMMGGSISVKSSSGKGSSFTVHFPALPESEVSNGSNLN
jgi:signal transduction histidine kinase